MLQVINVGTNDYIPVNPNKPSAATVSHERVSNKCFSDQGRPYEGNVGICLGSLLLGVKRRTSEEHSGRAVRVRRVTLKTLDPINPK